jgi:hypothetical protein
MALQLTCQRCGRTEPLGAATGWFHAELSLRALTRVGAWDIRGRRFGAIPDGYDLCPACTRALQLHWQQWGAPAATEAPEGR